MKEDFLRPPQSVAEYGADAVRVIGILSVLVAAIWSTPTDAGILALAAAKLGAARVTGTDIDPHAMDAARYNAERNGATLELLHSRENIDHTADVVVANILANPLTVLAPLLCGLTRSGGRIALSGILAAQTDMVRAAYRPAFELEVAGERDGWVLLTGTRV